MYSPRKGHSQRLQWHPLEGTTAEILVLDGALKERRGFSPQRMKSRQPGKQISHLDRVSVGGRWGSLCGQEQIGTEGGMP